MFDQILPFSFFPMTSDLQKLSVGMTGVANYLVRLCRFIGEKDYVFTFMENLELGMREERNECFVRLPLCEVEMYSVL